MMNIKRQFQAPIAIASLMLLFLGTFFYLTDWGEFKKHHDLGLSQEVE